MLFFHNSKQKCIRPWSDLTKSPFSHRDVFINLSCFHSHIILQYSHVFFFSGIFWEASCPFSRRAFFIYFIFIPVVVPFLPSSQFVWKRGKSGNIFCPLKRWILITVSSIVGYLKDPKCLILNIFLSLILSFLTPFHALSILSHLSLSLIIIVLSKMFFATTNQNILICLLWTI